MWFRIWCHDHSPGSVLINRPKNPWLTLQFCGGAEQKKKRKRKKLLYYIHKIFMHIGPHNCPGSPLQCKWKKKNRMRKRDGEKKNIKRLNISLDLHKSTLKQMYSFSTWNFVCATLSHSYFSKIGCLGVACSCTANTRELHGPHAYGLECKCHRHICMLSIYYVSMNA